uniref:C-type lectin domain-containing protein n=1 Tax=Anolis carolinensis TaxID=28377 RepID=A0A803TTJ4_ANOCA
KKHLHCYVSILLSFSFFSPRLFLPRSELGLVLCFHILLLGLLATSIFLNGIEAAGCPSGWLRIQEYCYGLFSVRMSWEEAETACQSFKQNCHLASIISEQEGNIISRFILTQHNPKEGVWIGLYDSTEVSFQLLAFFFSMDTQSS